jgi:hypothetical protein
MIIGEHHRKVMLTRREISHDETDRCVFGPVAIEDVSD